MPRMLFENQSDFAEQKSAMRWEKDGRGRFQKEEEEELKLSAPIERPKVEIDESFGLAPVEDDLLAPKAPPVPEIGDETPARSTAASIDDIPALEIIDDDDPFEAVSYTHLTLPTKA